MGLQLENEFVKNGMIISHLMNLKNMAVEAGFDVPIYSMTHWMDTRSIRKVKSCRTLAFTWKPHG